MVSPLRSDSQSSVFGILSSAENNEHLAGIPALFMVGGSTEGATVYEHAAPL
jgi:hypothetical protein